MAFGQAWQVTALAFKAAYEHVGMVMLSNVSWFIVALAPFLLVSMLQVTQPVILFAAVIGTSITVGPATAGIHHLVNKLIDKEETSLADFRFGLHKYFGRSVGLTLLMSFLLLMLGLNLIFSVNSPILWIRLLSGLWFYLILFWAVVVQYVFPFLVQQDIGVLLSVKRGALLALDNVLLSLLVTVLVIIVAVLSVVLAAPIILLFMVLAAFIQNFTLREALKKYDTGKGIK